MDNETIFNWWITKNKKKIIGYINYSVMFEQLEGDALVKLRRELILNYIDTDEGAICQFLAVHFEGFFDKIYKKIYESA